MAVRERARNASHATPSGRPRTIARIGVGRALHQFVARYPRALSERVLAHAGLGPEQLASPDGWLNHRALIESLDLGARDGNDPAFGLSFAEQASWSDFGALSHVVFNSPTVGAALENACRYFGIHQTSARPTLEVGNSTVRFVYTLQIPGLRSHAQHSESILAMVVRICREGSGDSAWAPREIHFKHSQPAENLKAVKFFRCRIVYDQPVDAVVMSDDVLALAMQSADPDLLQPLISDADERLAKVPVDFPQQVARIVMSSLGTGDATVDYVASRVGSSPRTVQRRLRARGIAFNDLVADIRYDLSQSYLKDPSLTLTDVAFLLGYSDLSAFSRAFRRWAGRTAIAFRRDHLRKTARRS
jgi:AraC-like DNA-binding protein